MNLIFLLLIYDCKDIDSFLILKRNTIEMILKINISQFPLRYCLLISRNV